jgi:hypothetical protein
MIIDQSNFLNFPTIMITEVFGSSSLFVLVGIVVIGLLALKSKVQFPTLLIIEALWVLICLTIAYSFVALTLLLFAVGVSGYLMYIKWLEGR